jgi:hypothetical protein
MSILRKREGDNLEILKVEEILKGRGYSRNLTGGSGRVAAETIHQETLYK